MGNSQRFDVSCDVVFSVLFYWLVNISSWVISDAMMWVWVGALLFSGTGRRSAPPLNLTGLPGTEKLNEREKEVWGNKWTHTHTHKQTNRQTETSAQKILVHTHTHTHKTNITPANGFIHKHTQTLKNITQRALLSLILWCCTENDLVWKLNSLPLLWCPPTPV